MASCCEHVNGSSVSISNQGRIDRQTDKPAANYLTIPHLAIQTYRHKRRPTFPLIFRCCGNRPAEVSTRSFAHVDMQHSQHSRHSLPLTKQTVMYAAPQRDTNVTSQSGSMHMDPGGEYFSVYSQATSRWSGFQNGRGS
jgi:hypothetical protein